ncbi:MAG: tRNA (adenosine(37)-N6)-dimethylallyltransferase MiaA [Parcubacteria group bacterium]|nr:tRNA (adenosine(37)-N6)-dimethylallyltransferase MiaA [Parcubacteria group bacterium]
MLKQPLVIIAGPNASGKSELAVKLAKKFNGEIVSADSRQVYKGMDIGTGKVSGKWLRVQHSVSNIFVRHRVLNKRVFVYKNVAHYCIDFVSPKRRFTVTEYQKCAAGAIADIHARGKVPFLVGGTGFYIKAVVDATTFPTVPPQIKLRKKLEKKTTAQLATLLKQKDPRRWRGIDRKNRRRLIRALEIIYVTRKPVPKHDSATPYHLLYLGVRPEDDAVLKMRIAKRLRQRLQSGMVAEVRQLHKKGLSWRRLDELGLEYRYVAQYIRGKCTRKALGVTLEKEIWQYARRQITWFRKEKRIRLVHSEKEAEKQVAVFLSKINTGILQNGGLAAVKYNRVV